MLLIGTLKMAGEHMACLSVTLEVEADMDGHTSQEWTDIGYLYYDMKEEKPLYFATDQPMPFQTEEDAVKKGAKWIRKVTDGWLNDLGDLPFTPLTETVFKSYMNDPFSDGDAEEGELAEIMYCYMGEIETIHKHSSIQSYLNDQFGDEIRRNKLKLQLQDTVTFEMNATEADLDELLDELKE